MDLGEGGEGEDVRAGVTQHGGHELTKVLHSLGEGTFVTPERLTLGEYLESWLAGLAVTGKRQTTITSYRERLTLHFLPRLGAARLQALTALDLDRLYAELLANGRRDGKGGLSPASVRYTPQSSARPLATPGARS